MLQFKKIIPFRDADQSEFTFRVVFHGKPSFDVTAAELHSYPKFQKRVLAVFGQVYWDRRQGGDAGSAALRQECWMDRIGLYLVKPKLPEGSNE